MEHPPLRIQVIATSDEDVQCRITGWDNFGRGMDAKIQKHLDGVAPDDGDDAIEDEEADELLNKGVELIQSMARDTPGMSELEPLMGSILKNLQNGDGADGSEDTSASDGLDDDPDVYTVVFDDPPWPDNHLKELNAVLENWGRCRETVLDAAFAFYKEQYEDIWLTWGGEKEDKIVLPDPTERSVLKDLFRVDTFHLSGNQNVFSVSGPCTWDDEHGFGARIEKGRVTEFGGAGDVG